MKNSTIFTIIVTFLMVVLFSQCYKAPTYKVKVICHYSEGVDTGDVVNGATVTIGRESYPNGESAEYAKAEGITGADGVFEYEFLHEALLDVNTTITITNEDGGEDTYVGTGQVKLVSNEVVEKVILMRK